MSMSDTPTSTAASGRGAVDQDQFLTVLSREEAQARFEAALFPRPLAIEERSLAAALGLALAQNIAAPIDVPPFDRFQCRRLCRALGRHLGGQRSGGRACRAQ